MKRTFLTAAGMLALLHSFAREAKDSTAFQSRKLSIEEVNFVSSYYTQNGNNAAVTGGIGSEKLTDIANVFDIKLTMLDKKLRKHTFDAEIGIDHYSSASSDMIDLRANSSASHADTRIYPSLSWNVDNTKTRRTIGAALSLSKEFDYLSLGANVFVTQKTKNKNGEFTAKLQAYLDQVTLITPIELRTGGGRSDDYGTASRNTFAGSVSYAQVINTRLQVIVLADLVQQNGYLSLPFHRVYFNDGSVHQENLPDSRLKIPLGLRANYFLGDRVIIRAYYRFYTDDWGLKSHTANIEVPVKINPFLSLSPFYRYYTQSAIDYFSAYKMHTGTDQYFTSNYDLSKFNSHFFGLGIRYAPAKGLLGLQHVSMVELRYGHYTRSTHLTSDIISLNLKFK